jgi:RimJ/RimL family protein N-acetyltransferase
MRVGHGPDTGSTRDSANHLCGASGAAQPGAANIEVSGPVLVSRRVRIEPVSSQHHEFLHALASNPLNGFRWHHGGNVPPFDVFVAGLWQGVLAQYVVVSINDQRLVGHCLLYNPEINHGHVSFGVIVTPDVEGSGVGVEAAFLVLRTAFKLWNLRKIYLDVPEFNSDSIAGGVGRYFHEEARLRGHLYYDGRWWDRVTLAMYRADLEALDARFGSLLDGTADITDPEGGSAPRPVSAGTSGGTTVSPSP